MRYKKLVVLGLALVMGVAVVQGAMAARVGLMGGAGPATGPGVGPMAGAGRAQAGQFGWAYALGLTSDQVEKIEQLQQSHQEQVQPLQEELRKLALDLNSLWADPKANADQIKEKAARATELQIELRQKALDYQESVKQVLTPEQQEKLSQLQAGGRIGAGFGGQGRGARGWGMHGTHGGMMGRMGPGMMGGFGFGPGWGI